MARRMILNESLLPEDLARLARLTYVSDEQPGLSRRRNGRGFKYFTSQGKVLRAARQLDRIEALAIPPAWRDVWICRIAKGHLQATGRDAKKRKQYVYHERWQHIAGVAKFARLRGFGKALPKLREAVARDLRGRKLTKRRVLAAMVALLDLTGIRVGNEEYAKENGSYGLTTLRNRHVTVTRHGVELRFRGKGGLKRDVLVDDKPLARLIAQCSKLAGARVFQYVDDDGKPQPVTSTDVNEYLQELAGENVTAKDFRTWKASALAVGRLRDAAVESRAGRKKLGRAVVDEVAELLANTAAVCRSYYIHPGVVECYEAGSLGDHFQRFRPRRHRWLTAEEQLLARFLRRWKPSVDA